MGDRVVKVAKKIFVFLSSPDAERPGLTVKLPDSHDHASELRGLDTARLRPRQARLGDDLRRRRAEGGREVLFDFIEESYRAVVPKTLVKRLDVQSDAEE